ncbi:MAG: ATP-binding protein [Anaerolineae bacterium]
MLMLPDFRVRQRDFLLEISRAITAQLEIGEVLRRVLNASVVMLAGQVGIIALRASDGLFYARAVSGIDSDQIPLLNRHLHALIETQDGLDAESFDQKLRQMAADIDRKLRQSVALPLIFAEEPLGLMIVFRNYRSNATANDLQILQSFADQAAIAVHNAQLYERIDQERKRLAAILDHSADGVMILDQSLHIIRFNRALERMTGWRAEDAMELHQDEVFSWQQLEHGDLQTAIDEGWPYLFTSGASDQTSLYVEGDLVRRDGLTLSVGITYAPLFTADGKLANIIANVRDITKFREAQEIQNTFISVISHELKTPVAIIKGYAATLRRPDAAWKQEIVQETLGVIEDEADRLDALIQNLLTASKLQAQRGMSLDIGEVWLKDLAERSVERFSKQTQKHHLILNFPNDFPPLHGDEARLLQVLDNLIGNAIKYSPEGGQIEVGGKFDDQHITVYVSDPGVGLSAEDRKRVFERFYRVDGKLSRKTQGTGLGLYLSKAIIDAHNGIIAVDSQLGKGSTFYFTLPR